MSPENYCTAVAQVWRRLVETFNRFLGFPSLKIPFILNAAWLHTVAVMKARNSYRKVLGRKCQHIWICWQCSCKMEKNFSIWIIGKRTGSWFCNLKQRRKSLKEIIPPCPEYYNLYHIQSNNLSSQLELIINRQSLWSPLSSCDVWCCASLALRQRCKQRVMKVLGQYFQITGTIYWPSVWWLDMPLSKQNIYFLAYPKQES